MAKGVRRFARLLGMGLVVGGLGGCALLTDLPEPSGLDQRLATLPTHNLPLEQAVTIHWNERKVPFIEAASDTDAAFSLGLVHAHLRLGQMEVLRRISQGRLAEMGGPIATDIDRALRVLDYGKVAPAVVAAMPADERAWLDAFVAGVNHYQRTTSTLPHEFAFLGLDPEPWRPEDVVTLGRLASTDVTWLVWFRLMGLRDRPDWPQLWRRAIEAGTSSAPSFAQAATEDVAALESVLSGTSRIGSNSIAVAGSRTASGAALMANDPHLGLSLPNLWLIVGVKSPSYHMLGLMVPGLPFVAVGRNRDIAWGGTNMRAASSDLYDVSALPAHQMTTRRETIDVRWWFDTDVSVRETAYGPVISDAPQVVTRDGEVWALRWIGHRPSDELTAMLHVNRAAGWHDFTDALAGFAVSPQNFLYADVHGNIGQVTATHLPRRPKRLPDDIVVPLESGAAWDDILTSRDLPQAFNPETGFLVSANNRGSDDAPVPIGYFFSSNDRVTRMQAMLSGTGPVTPEDLAALQRDTYQASSVALRDALLARWDGIAATQPALARPVADALTLLRGWDGRYEPDSAGALAFEAMMVGFVDVVYDEDEWRSLSVVGRPYTLLIDDLPGIPDSVLRDAMAVGLAGAVEVMAEFGTWGSMHRLSVNHVLGLIPVIGGRYTFADLPTGGSRETLWKTGHTLTAERHLVRFGANARHISDLSDLDANWFVLMGGQDGWFNSATFRDQIDLWQQGDYVRVPMRLESIRARFGRRTVLTPGRDLAGLGPR